MLDPAAPLKSAPTETNLADDVVGVRVAREPTLTIGVDGTRQSATPGEQPQLPGGGLILELKARDCHGRAVTLAAMPENDRWAMDDVIAADSQAAAPPILEVYPDIPLIHRPSHTIGTVVSFSEGNRIVLVDQDGNHHEFKPFDGVFEHRGVAVSLRAPTVAVQPSRQFTASGSIDVGPVRARTARAGRIWVEGIHDAELIEQVWGDDLRVEGIVVEPLHGADDLAQRLQTFRPARARRIGVLLDHLVPGSKESRIAAGITDPNVLICGHPYVDIWQAIKPGTLGIGAWPRVPPGRPWKEGVIAALGSAEDPGPFWRSVLGRVSSYTDVETPLINAVEQLIDFVTA